MGGKGTGITLARERLDRMNELWKIIIRVKDVQKAVAMFQFRYGTSRRTTLDYVKVLKTAGKI